MHADSLNNNNILRRLHPHQYCLMSYLARFVNADDVHELIAVMEHDEFIDIARPEHAVIVDQPLQNKYDYLKFKLWLPIDKRPYACPQQRSCAHPLT